MDGKKTPIEQSIIDRVVSGVRYAITGVKPEEWMSPQQPLQPMAQEAVGRQYDYQIGHNTRVSSTKEGVTFKDLRALADGYDLLRLVIETRKDQIEALNWTVKYKDPKKKPDATIEAIQQFFAFPDQEHDHNTWLRALLEDLFVLDALTIYPRMTKGGQLYALEMIDGSTINRLIDGTGRTPLPPDPAYQQILKGIPAVDYTRDELIYKPRNVRTNKLYGFSPVEQIIITVNIALRRQVGQLQYYTEGNIPEALASVPETWSVNQIKEFQSYWDAIIEGEQAHKRKLKFIPDGVKYQPTKEPVLKDEFDEWLARIVCYAFSVSPQALSKMMNRATAEVSADASADEGLKPLMKYVKNLHDYVIAKYFGRVDIEFAYVDKTETDPKVQADINVAYVGAKILTVDEVRADLGREPLTEEQKAELSPPQPIMDENNAPKDEETDAGKSVSLPKLKSFSIKKSDDLTEGDAIDRERKAITDKMDEAKEVISKQLYKFGKTVSGNIGKLWDKRILNRWQKGEYDRVYINGLTHGKAYFEDTYGDLSLKSFLSVGKDAEKFDEEIIAALKKAFGDYWQGVYYPQMGAQNAISYADIVAKSTGVNTYLNKIDDVDFNLIVKKIEPIMAEAYKDGIGAGFEAIAYVPEYEMLNVLNDGAVVWAEARGLELAKLGETTKDFLRPLIEKAIKDGMSTEALKKELMDHYAFSETRARTIARTEMAFADSAGNFDAWDKSGIVKYKKSKLGTNENHGVDDIENAAQGIIPFKQPFQSGHMYSPYHPNCVCVVIPVLEKPKD